MIYEFDSLYVDFISSNFFAIFFKSPIRITVWRLVVRPFVTAISPLILNRSPPKFHTI